jgi:hypothetical protein
MAHLRVIEGINRPYAVLRLQAGMERNLTEKPVTSYQDRLHRKFEISRQLDGRWLLCCFVPGAHLCVPDANGANKSFATAEECVALFRNPDSTDGAWVGFLDKIKGILQGGEPTLEIPAWLSSSELQKLGGESKWSPDNSTP